MMHNRLAYYSIGISFSMHAIILLTLGLAIDFTQVSIQLGDADDQRTHSVAAYILNQPVEPKISKKQKQVKPEVITHQSADIALSKRHAKEINKRDVTSIGKNASHQSEMASLAGSAGEKTSELVVLLHAAIQAKQRYPVSALQIGQEGRVNVMFVLYKNGFISDLRIARSSGTDSLDQAALVAVKEAAPFKGVEKHLLASQEYSIEVVFELTG